jgi:hypothetical protein
MSRQAAYEVIAYLQREQSADPSKDSTHIQALIDSIMATLVATEHLRPVTISVTREQAAQILAAQQEAATD